MLRIKAERLRRGWTQLQLAVLTRLQTTEISRIENGRFRPYPGQMLRLCNALELTPEELLEEDEENG